MFFDNVIAVKKEVEPLCSEFILHQGQFHSVVCAKIKSMLTSFGLNNTTAHFWANIKIISGF